MPTILQIEGFRFFFFSNEAGEPPHIHARKGDGYAKLWLEPLELAHSRRLTAPELRRIRELCKEHRDEFIKAWHRYFG